MAMPTLPDSRTEPDGSTVIRVLSYNIRSMRDDNEALARVIRACAPDLVFVQEAPRFFRWRKRAAWLAAHTDLVVLSGGATAAGPLLLCSLRATVERTEDLLLPLTPGLHRRGFATAVVRIGGARIGLLSCHLSLQSAERDAQAGMVLDRLKAMDVPHTIVAGDLNDRPTGRSFRLLAGELQDCWALAPWGDEYTSPAEHPRRRIDAIFATHGIEVLGCGVPRDLPGLDEADLRAATDHLPVLAALRVPAS
ncbi:endonuclease/exonuclease/phosphatase family protein [Streptomyces scopuliridis]|uniref:Endonuclease/exonuclease/phosphatase n=2 Tax=Streptomyces scopuliridis TaxID=452529 RepID=A0A2T7SQ69_9ACTN|nr:endonuclease/exonuclease/phosphatase family protein [Streptomyces scopuliridis]PVE05110.1 endonuclease/exonuclease/phosphatase [Streptomyces scopuliridis RB72]WSB36248.1 endonuclease/exonuclease/phosphatase family protein [Streptomyces scopuliridis]WSC00545.1 endonuclease/exonuclease/phosphatase family protein [Streptomyces scopuliridis]WSC05844.1 endonuclease/exonuclease/phosphatase family protein [Streptomyces scopuliridis]